MTKSDRLLDHMTDLLSDPLALASRRLKRFPLPKPFLNLDISPTSSAASAASTVMSPSLAACHGLEVDLFRSAQTERRGSVAWPRRGSVTRANSEIVLKVGVVGEKKPVHSREFVRYDADTVG